MYIHTVEFWNMTFAKNETMNNLFLGQWLKRSVLKDARSRPSAWHLKSLSIPDENPCRTDKTKTTATERNSSGNSHLKVFFCVLFVVAPSATTSQKETTLIFFTVGVNMFILNGTLLSPLRQTRKCPLGA